MDDCFLLLLMIINDCSFIIDDYWLFLMMIIDYWLLLMIICYCNRTNFNQVIRPVLKILFFLR